MDRETLDRLIEESTGLNGHESMNGYDHEEEEERQALTDEADHEILMHRDVHFGGDFAVMLRYYEEDGLGVNPSFDIERIHYLAAVEKELGGNLAALMLTSSEAERVAQARAAYSKLKEIYQRKSSPIERLVADLLLCEEDDPQELIAEILEKGVEIVPSLLEIVQTADLYDALAPGYGLAPALAAHCLGDLQVEKAIIPLFEILGRETEFDEEVILDALGHIGTPARDFLIKRLKGRPITADTLYAAFALSGFPQDQVIATAAYEELLDPEVQRKPLLATYLVCHCDALQKTAHREHFVAMAKDLALPKTLRVEIENIVRNWK